MHLTYREKYYETQANDYEFSRVAMEEGALAGRPRRYAAHEQLWLERPKELDALRTLGITGDFD